MSVLSSCLENLRTQLLPLLEDGSFREVEMRLSVAHECKAAPALHIIPGDESAAEEDTCGYTMTRQILLKVIFGTTRDPFCRAAELVAFVQAALEKDETLGGKAIRCTYRGEQPFITDATSPQEGTFVQYELVYRRKTARPDLQY